MGRRKGYIGPLIGGILLIAFAILMTIITINPYIIYDPNRWDITVDISVPITAAILYIFGGIIIVLFIVNPEALEFWKKKGKGSRPKGGYDIPKKPPKLKYNKPHKKKKPITKSANTCYDCGKEIPDDMTQCKECKEATLSMLD